MKGTGKSILLLGDSHARMLIPTFTAIAEKEHLTLSVDGEPSCPWQRGLYTLTSFGSCQRLKTDAYRRVINELKPDIVVAMNLDYGKPGRDYPHTLMTFQGHAASLRTLERLTRSSVEELTAGGRQLVIVEPIPLAVKPTPNFEPLRCLERARVEEECQYTANMGSSPLEQLYRQIADENHNVLSLDLDKQVCPLLPICNPIVNGEIVKGDPSHLTAQFARSLAPYVETYLRSVGLLPIARGSAADAADRLTSRLASAVSVPCCRWTTPNASGSRGIAASTTRSGAATCTRWKRSSARRRDSRTWSRTRRWARA